MSEIFRNIYGYVCNLIESSLVARIFFYLIVAILAVMLFNLSVEAGNDIGVFLYDIKN